MLKETTLFEKIDRVKMAIDRLRQFEPPEGYYLAFSGGKDSVCIYQLALMAGVKFDAHYNNTTIDPPELIYFIRKHYPNVKFHNPKISMLKMLETRGFPLRQARWCCAEFKEGGGSGRYVVTGVRQAESFKRSKRRMVEVCMKDTSKRYLHPIIDWSEEDVWEFIRKNGFPYCYLYNLGFKRLGCLFCPNATPKEKQMQLEMYPKYKALFIKSFEKLYQNRKDKPNSSVSRWKSGEEMFNWWIYEMTSKKDNADQTIMFE